MIELRDDSLRFQFPEVHAHASCDVGFVRTLRIPDDNRERYLPPGLGSFPLDHVDDFAKRAPETWVRRGGVFLPMYQAEAIWLNFGGDYPMVVKIAAGKVNALRGEPWSDELYAQPKQDYIVLPDQPWLDGFYAGEGLIQQFVAMQLGGYTAEEQMTGEAEHGGLQIVAYPMKAGLYEKLRRRSLDVCYDMQSESDAALACKVYMGLAPSGLMRQEI